ncbi:MAG TPA: glycosyltransferase family 4 protein [Stellaceae bacterium]|nr:glycosyltransferase family 4 protein [Stellaceae bacterium]
MTRRKRFVLVDPSLVAKDGDKWQYAVLFAKSAAANGYDFTLLTHRDAPAIGRVDGHKVDQRGIFTATFFAHADIVARHVGDAAAARAREAKAKGKAAARGRASSTSAKRREPAAGLRLRADAGGVAAPFNRDDFAIALAAELRALDLRSGDHVFFHTMTYGMLESLCEVTCALDLEKPIDADAHFLFHFGIEASDARTFLDRYYQYSHVESLGRRLRCGAPFRRLHFLATNPALREEASRLLEAPVGLFEGLADLAGYFTANGGAEATAHRRRRVHDAQALRKITLGIRAGDLSGFDSGALRVGVEILRRFDFDVVLKIFFNGGSLPLLRDFARLLADIQPKFVDVSDNDQYIREITQSSLMLLTYDSERYAKRVSAVLHDCSVLGVPALVPARTTLADAAHYARIFVYRGAADFGATLLYAARALCRNPETSFAKARIAREIYGADVVTRITGNPTASLTVDRIGPIANLIMPLWGRVGSSHIFEAQIAFLLSRGYFVQQVLVLDKPADKTESIPYFWRMLYENTRRTRGSVQRIAFPRLEDQARVGAAAKSSRLDGYQAYEAMLAMSDLEDPHFAARMRRAEVTIVNHVFHAGFALAHSTRNRILESHDIQSYNLSRRPLTDPTTGAPDPLSRIMASEMASVAKFDYVVNIVPEEDAVLSIFNPRTKLVIPYIPRIPAATRHASVAAFATANRLHESYRGVDRFDLLFIGDSHENNVNAGRWLLRDVFKPHLLERGCSLAICGRVSDALYEAFEGLASVFFLGFVEDLPAVYALSRIVLLPDQSGTGISIKALEAFAAGKPVVATPTAVRGFHARLPEDFRTHKDAASFASAVIDALGSDERRRALAELSLRSYAAVSSREAVEGSWDDVFRSLGIVAPAPAAKGPAPALPGRDAARPSRSHRPVRKVVDEAAPAGGATATLLHERLSLQRSGGATGWETCRALLRWVPETVDVIAATLPGSYLERRLRESVNHERLFIHPVAAPNAFKGITAPASAVEPLVFLGDRDRDLLRPPRPWPVAAQRDGARIRMLDTLYASSHRPGLIVIEEAAVACAILAGAELAIRQAPAILICLASSPMQDRAALWRTCSERLAGRGYEWVDGLLAPWVAEAPAGGVGDVICALPQSLVAARRVGGAALPSMRGA